MSHCGVRYPSLLDEDGRLLGIHQYFADADPFLRDMVFYRFKLKPIRGGYVYLLRDIDDGAIKIGVTLRSVKTRMYQIRNSGSYSVTTEFLHAIVCHDAQGMEQALHWQLKFVEGKQRKKYNEYYHLLLGDIDRLMHIKSYNGIPVQHLDTLLECEIDYSRRQSI